MKSFLPFREKTTLCFRFVVGPIWNVEKNVSYSFVVCRITRGAFPWVIYMLVTVDAYFLHERFITRYLIDTINKTMEL